jgi:hypothetical protein
MIRAQFISYKYDMVPPNRWDSEMKEYAEYHKRWKQLEKYPIDEMYRRFFYDSGAVPIAEQLVCDLRNAGFPVDSIPVRKDMGLALTVAQMLQQKAYLNFMESMVSKACEGKRIDESSVPEPKTFPDLAFFEPGDGPKVAKLVNDELSLPNPQPIALSMCPGLLLRRGDVNWYRTVKNPKRDDFPETDCAESDKNDFPTDKPGPSHVILVIGRRPNPQDSGKCQFLVRNTLHSKCKNYKSAGWTDCDENGDVWIDAAALSANTYRASYIGN